VLRRADATCTQSSKNGNGTVTSTDATFTTATALPVSSLCCDQIFSDAFGRTTGLGSGWNVWWGSFSTDGTAAISGAPPIQGNWASVTQPLRTNDYAVAADLVIPAGSLYSGLVARGSTSQFTDNLYAAQISTDGGVYLYRRNDWTWTALGTAPRESSRTCGTP
jgi:hypothetical protein